MKSLITTLTLLFAIALSGLLAQSCAASGTSDHPCTAVNPVPVYDDSYWPLYGIDWLRYRIIEQNGRAVLAIQMDSGAMRVSDDEFLTGLFWGILHHEAPMGEGMDHHRRELARGVSRQYVFEEFAEYAGIPTVK